MRAAAASVVRVLGTACGLGISGSGWVAAPGLVVTAAHVVAGESSTSVVDPVSDKRLAAQAVGFDPKNDVAVLRVPGLGARPLAMVEPEPDRLVGIVGYPLNGPLDIEPGRIGKTAHVLTDDAYGKGPVDRTITSLSGVIRHGNSGGPAIDSEGRVQTMVFATKIGEPGGYGVPAEVVRKVLRVADAARRHRRVRALGQQLEHRQRPPVRRDDVDAGAPVARRGDQLARVREADLGLVATPRRAAPPAAARGRRCRAPRCAAAARAGSDVSGKTPASTGTGDGPPSLAMKRSRSSRSKTICVIAKLAPSSTFRRKRSSSSSGSSAFGFTATPMKNDVGASIALPL